MDRATRADGLKDKDMAEVQYLVISLESLQLTISQLYMFLKKLRNNIFSTEVSDENILSK